MIGKKEHAGGLISRDTFNNEDGFMFSTTRADRRYLEAENKKWQTKMTRVPEDQLPRDGSMVPMERQPIEVWRSREFLAQIFALPDGVVRISVLRAHHDGKNWRQDIAWEEMQQIKSECGRGDLDAVEIYPADRDVVRTSRTCATYLFCQARSRSRGGDETITRTEGGTWNKTSEKLFLTQIFPTQTKRGSDDPLSSFRPGEEEKLMSGLEMKYFVLKPKGGDVYAAASRAAMKAYAKAVKDENPDLAKGLREWADSEQYADASSNPAR